MIRYSVLVLLVCVYYSSYVKAQVIIASGSGSCDGRENEYINFIRCMIECDEEEYGTTGLYEEDFCTNGIEIIIEGSGPDSFTVDDVKKALKCIAGKCKSAVPPSCGDSSPPIVADIPDDVENDIIDQLNSGQYVDVSKLKSQKSSHSSEQENSRSRHRHVKRRKVIHHRRVHKRVHRRQHLLRKLALAYGIPDGQLEDLVTQLDDASGSPPDTSGKDILDRLADAAEKLPGSPDDSGSTMDKVEELLTKLVEDSGTPDQDEAATVLLNRLMGISGLREDQLNELLSILEKVSKKKTSQLDDSDIYEILLPLLNDSGHPPGEVEIPYGSQPGSYAFASGSQPGGFAVAYAPVPQPGTFENLGPQFQVPDTSITPSSDGTPGSTVSGATSVSGPTDTTSATTASSDSALSPVESLDDCDDFDENAPNFVEVPNSFGSASAVAIASSNGNSAISPIGDIDYSLDDSYSPDDYYDYDEDVPYYDYENVVYYDGDDGTDYDCDNTDYDYGNGTDYDYGNGTDYDYGNDTYYDYYDDDSENGTFTDISYYYDNSIAEPSIGGSASAFAGVQEINLNPYVQQNQPINVVSSSASAGGVQINQNPIGPFYQTNEQNVGGIFTGGGQNTGLLPNDPLQNAGFIQNPTPLVNGQNGAFGTASVGGQLLNQNLGPLQNAFPQIQGSNQNPGQIVNSFIQSQGFNSNPVQQQYQGNNYGSGYGTNQQFLGQLANNPVQPAFPNIDPLAGASVGTIFSPAVGGSSGQTIPISANVPAQTQAFLGSNTGGNGPINIQQNSGIASQIPAGGNNQVGAASSAIASSGLTGTIPVPSQAFTGNVFGNAPLYAVGNGNIPQFNGGGNNQNSALASAIAAASGTGSLAQTQSLTGSLPVQGQVFPGINFGNGPSLNSPQINGGGIDSAGSSASAAAGAFAGTRNLGQVQGGSLNVPVQSQAFTGGNFGNGQQLSIPQYNGNAAQQFNGGGIGQIPNGAGGSSYASGVSNSGATAGNNGFFNSPGISNSGQSFAGNVPSNQGQISSFGNSASAAAGSSAGIQSFAM